MKRLMLLFVFSVLSIALFSQEPAKFDYCEIVGTAKLLSTKVTVQIDFGQGTKLFADNRYKDESGNPISFNSMIDAMNYMGKQGWEFVQAYAVTIGNTGAVYRYVLKKKVIEAKVPEI